MWMYTFRRRRSSAARKNTVVVVLQGKNGEYRCTHTEERIFTNVPFCHICVCVQMKTGERARPFLTHGTLPDECGNCPRDAKIYWAQGCCSARHMFFAHHGVRKVHLPIFCVSSSYIAMASPSIYNRVPLLWHQCEFILKKLKTIHWWDYLLVC